MITYFNKNVNGTDYVVGDIHFAFRKLQRQLDSFFNPEVDRLFSVGDLVDRGLDIDLLEVWLDYEWFHPVMGNHEQMIVRGMWDSSIMNGGAWFYALLPEDQDRIQQKLSQLPLGMEIQVEGGKVGVVHADPCTYDWDEFKRAPQATEVVWNRDRIRYKDVQPVANIDRVYVGHTPTDPCMLGNVIFLDNAAWHPMNPDKPFNIQKL